MGVKYIPNLFVSYKLEVNKVSRKVKLFHNDHPGKGVIWGFEIPYSHLGHFVNYTWMMTYV